MFKNKQKQAFTLVELIVVITILAILGTIAFISLQGYSSQSRDSLRISDMASIKTGLELFQLDSGKYPLPTDEFAITYSGAMVWTQGYFGEQTIKNINKLDKIPIDPLTDKKYVYSTTNTRQEFQLACVMEGDQIGINNLVSETNAGQKAALLKITGNYNGKLLKTSTGGIDYVLALPSLMSSSGTILENIVSNNLLAYNGYKNLPFQYEGGSYKALGETNLNLVNNSNLVVFSGSLNTLLDTTSIGVIARLNLMTQLQNAYTGTIIKDEGQIQPILLTTESNAIESLGLTIVNNNLGGSMVSGSTPSFSSSTSSGGNSNSQGIYVDDVFSTYLYSGNGGSQTINNGIDLTAQGGMTWVKSRNYGDYNILTDTVRGDKYDLYTDYSGGSAQHYYDAGGLSFNSNGFTVGSYGGFNSNNGTYSSWTFRKSPKFFDVVTYVGDGTSNRQIAHNLGIEPGMIITKKISGSSNWAVYHRGISSGGEKGAMFLNTTDGFTSSSTYWNNTVPTSTNFTVGNADSVNLNGQTYIAYIYAHDPSVNGIIQEGSFTTDGTSKATINLGWEPQWILIKPTTGAYNWAIFDTLRGMTVDSNSNYLLPNSSNAEVSSTLTVSPNATGFEIKGGSSIVSSTNYIYMAIRRPNKPVTNGNQVLSMALQTPPGTAGYILNNNSGFPIDFLLSKWTSVQTPYINSRLTNNYLQTSSTSTEGIYNYGFDRMKGVSAQWSAANTLSYALRRSPGIFDQVAYTGNGVAGTKYHNLGVTPEMIIFKNRSSSSDWGVYHSSLGNSSYTLLNSSNAVVNSNILTNSVTPSSSQFSIGNNIINNVSGNNYIAYLFASKPGISKVGFYTGNGTSQIINANFTSSARFIIIKRTDIVGDWYVWDSVRGILTNGNDSYFTLNTTAAEVTTIDSVDPDSSGFIVKQNTTTNINVTNGNYIYLAFQ